MFRRISILSTAFVLTALAFAGPQANIQQGLSDGRERYDAGQYAEAVQTLTSADRRLSVDTPRELSVPIKLYLGVSLFYNEKPADAEEVFQQLCRIDPGYEMNRNGKEFKQEIVNLFQKAKAACDDELKKECSAKCSSAAQVITEGDPEKILTAVETLGSRCSCEDVRAKAAQTVLDIANSSFKNRDPKAQRQFEIAVRLNKGAVVPAFGTIHVIVGAPGGQLLINDVPVKVFKDSEAQDFLVPPARYRFSLQPADPKYLPGTIDVDLGINEMKSVELRPKQKTLNPIEMQQITLAPKRYLDIDLEKESDNGSVWFYGEKGINQLVPEKAEIFVLKTEYDRVNPSELEGFHYELKPQTVNEGMSIAVKTSSGKFATLKIIKSGATALVIKWISYR